jgi:hypothetical protein
MLVDCCAIATPPPPQSRLAPNDVVGDCVLCQMAIGSITTAFEILYLDLTYEMNISYPH